MNKAERNRHARGEIWRVFLFLTESAPHIVSFVLSLTQQIFIKLPLVSKMSLHAWNLQQSREDRPRPPGLHRVTENEAKPKALWEQTSALTVGDRGGMGTLAELPRGDKKAEDEKLNKTPSFPCHQYQRDIKGTNQQHQELLDWQHRGGLGLTSPLFLPDSDHQETAYTLQLGVLCKATSQCSLKTPVSRQTQNTFPMNRLRAQATYMHHAIAQWLLNQQGVGACGGITETVRSGHSPWTGKRDIHVSFADFDKLGCSSNCVFFRDKLVCSGAKRHNAIHSPGGQRNVCACGTTLTIG